MISLTEAELLRMREVQAQATKEEWTLYAAPTVFAFVAQARTDWPRLTEWALEARQFLRARFVSHDHTCSSLEMTTSMSCDCGYDEARRLLGER